MRGRRSLFGFTAVLAGACTVAAVVISVQGHATNAAAASRPWATRDLPGSVKLTGQVPLAVAKIPGAAATHHAGYVRPHPKSADIGLNFAFPLRDKAGLDQLIAQEARTHRYLTRAQIYARFAPPPAQVNALRSWLDRARLPRDPRRRRPDGDHGARADGGRREDAARQDQRLPQAGRPRSAGCKVRPYQFYANTTAPTIPARFGVQTISGPERRRPLLHGRPACGQQGRRVQRRRQRDHQPALRRRPQRRLLPGRPARALQHHRPRLRRHRPDDRLHALDGRREAGGDDCVRDRPATSGSPSIPTASRPGTRRRCRARARRRQSGPTTC